MNTEERTQCKLNNSEREKDWDIERKERAYLLQIIYYSFHTNIITTCEWFVLIACSNRLRYINIYLEWICVLILFIVWLFHKIFKELYSPPLYSTSGPYQLVQRFLLNIYSRDPWSLWILTLITIKINLEFFSKFVPKSKSMILCL